MEVGLWQTVCSYGGAYREAPPLVGGMFSRYTDTCTRMSMLSVSPRGPIKAGFQGSFDYQYESSQILLLKDY